MLQKLTAKDLSIEMNVSLATAKKYVTDIKKEYGLKTLLRSHVMKYFKVVA